MKTKLKQKMISITSKRIIGALLVFMMAFVVASQIKPSGGNAADITTDFTDPNFLTCVSTALGTPGHVDSVAAAALSGTLQCNYTNGIPTITSIAGAQYLTGLSVLNLDFNSITDMSPVSGLTNLTQLYLYASDITDYSPVSGLTNLTALNLALNNSTDISALSGLTNLTWLSLFYDGISDISPLSGMTKLTGLRLYANNISDISALSGLTKLTSLELGSNNISDISALSGMTNLGYIAFSGNNISDISALSGKTSIYRIDAMDNNISDISALSGLTNLYLLYLFNNNISDISALSGKTNLDTLAAYNNNISDISALSGLTNLRYLWLKDNNITDISPISGLTGIRSILLERNNITDISALSGFSNATEIRLDGNNISDISALSGATSATGIFLEDNNVSDLSPLSGLTTNLDWLFLNNNNISNLSPLSGMSNLGWVKIQNNPGLNGANAAAALAVVAILQGYGTIVDHNINPSVCGDGILQAGEQCDDGNLINGDGCNSTCQIEPVCGNGIMEGSETCDDGNVISGDGCDSLCQLELSCGDGILSIAEGELCDDGNTANDDGCNSACQPQHDFGCSFTFDEISGFPIADDFCATVCHDNFGYPGGYSPDALHCFCADKTVTECDTACTMLTGFGFNHPVCVFTEPAPAVCGDGNVDAGEECDDGNVINGDGCSSLCIIEAIIVGRGSSPAPAPPVCTAALTKIDLPATLPVNQIGGNPTVMLNWSKINTQEINTEQKIGILFNYFNQPIKPVIGANKKRVENVFAKYIYNEVLKDAELALLLKNKIGEINYKNLIGCDCDNDLALAVTNAVKALRSINEAKDRLNAIIINFANDLISLETVLTQADPGSETPFIDFYNSYFPSGVYEGMTVEIYRGGNLIHTEENPNNTSYSDDGLPLNKSGSVKYYDYYIRAKNICGDTIDGAAGQARIDPQVDAGKSVDVSVDLLIKIKDAYDELFMDKLKEIFLQKEIFLLNGTADITNTGFNEGEAIHEIDRCEEMRQAFLIEKKNDKMFDYILECFAGYDFRLRAKLEEAKSDIVPPLLKMLQLSEGKISRESIVEQFMYPLISKLNLGFGLTDAAKENLGNLNLNIAALTGKQMSDLTESEMNEIRKIGETVFEGASHSADLIIEKYDSENILLGSYLTHTDVFGMIKGVSIGQMTSGKDYTLKIRLKDAKYVLPHKVTLNITNALLSGGKYKSSVILNFPKHFRYGDFNQDDQINLQDIVEWGKILGERPEEWDNANLDGLQGINLLDVLTLQGNWGKLEETTFGQSQMSLGDFLKELGVSIISSSDLSLQAEVIIPGWLNVIRSACP